MKTILLISAVTLNFLVFSQEFSPKLGLIGMCNNHNFISLREVVDIPDSLIRDNHERCFFLTIPWQKSLIKRDCTITFLLNNGNVVTAVDNGKKQPKRKNKILYMSEENYNLLRENKIRYTVLHFEDSKKAWRYYIIDNQLF